MREKIVYEKNDKPNTEPIIIGFDGDAYQGFHKGNQYRSRRIDVVMRAFGIPRRYKPSIEGFLKKNVGRSIEVYVK